MTYYKMDAYHPFPWGDPRIFSTGTFRGHMPQVRADFTFNKQLTGHVLWEYLKTGDFYRNRTQAYFLRFELIYKYLGSKKL